MTRRGTLSMRCIRTFRPSHCACVRAVFKVVLPMYVGAHERAPVMQRGKRRALLYIAARGGCRIDAALAATDASAVRGQYHLWPPRRTSSRCRQHKSILPRRELRKVVAQRNEVVCCGDGVRCLWPFGQLGRRDADVNDGARSAGMQRTLWECMVTCRLQRQCR